MKRTDNDPYCDASWFNYRAFVWGERAAWMCCVLLMGSVIFTGSVVALFGGVVMAYFAERYSRRKRSAWDEYVWERDYLWLLRRAEK